MRDIDARHAARLQPADQRVQSLGISVRETARWLVENDDASATTHGRRDLNHLPVPDGQVAEAAIDIKRRPGFLEELNGATTCFLSINERTAPRQCAK